MGKGGGGILIGYIMAKYSSIEALVENIPGSVGALASEPSAKLHLKGN